MNQMIDINGFDVVERIMINKGSEGIPVEDFTRKNFLVNLSFARSISTDQDVIALLDGLISKVERITDEEWEKLKTMIPFDVYYGMDDMEES